MHIQKIADKMGEELGAGHQLTELIDSQRTELEAPNGTVMAAWNHKKEGSLQMGIVIPVNKKADIILPGKPIMRTGSGGHLFDIGKIR